MFLKNKREGKIYKYMYTYIFLSDLYGRVNEAVLNFVFEYHLGISSNYIKVFGFLFCSVLVFSFDTGVSLCCPGKSQTPGIKCSLSVSRVPRRPSLTTASGDF